MEGEIFDVDPCLAASFRSCVDPESHIPCAGAGGHPFVLHRCTAEGLFFLPPSRALRHRYSAPGAR